MTKTIRVEYSPDYGSRKATIDLLPEEVISALRREGYEVKEPPTFISASISNVQWEACAIGDEVWIRVGSMASNNRYKREHIAVIRDFLTRAESLLPKEGE